MLIPLCKSAKPQHIKQMFFLYDSVLHQNTVFEIAWIIFFSNIIKKISAIEKTSYICTRNKK